MDLHFLASLGSFPFQADDLCTFKKVEALSARRSRIIVMKFLAPATTRSGRLLLDSNCTGLASHKDNTGLRFTVCLATKDNLLSGQET